MNRFVFLGAPGVGKGSFTSILAPQLVRKAYRHLLYKIAFGTAVRRICTRRCLPSMYTVAEGR